MSIPDKRFEIVDETPNKNEEIAKGFKFFGYQPKAETIEKIRHPTGVALKGLTEGLLGTPGDLLNFFQRIVGIKEPKTILPTSENIGNLFETLSKEEFEPRNVGEEFAKRGSEFLGAILGLGGPLKGTTAAKSLQRSLLGAFVPGGVSLLGEKANLPPWLQVASTIGSSFLTHRLTGKGLKDIEKGLYNQSRSIAKDAEIPAKSLIKNIKDQIMNLHKGGLEESDKLALKKLNDTLSHVKNNKIKISDLMDLKVKLNESRGKLFAKDLGKTGVKSARRKLNDVANLLDKNINKFENPEFKKLYKQANQLHGGMAETRKIFKFLSSHPQVSGLTAAVLKYLIPSIFKPAAGIGAAAQVGQFGKALVKYPGYRRAYLNILKNASKEEIKGTAQALKKFNKIHKEISEKENQRFELVD